MEPIKHKYSNIDYKKDNIIEQINKHFKDSDDRILDEIAYSIESITKSMESIQKNHIKFLKVNKALALYVAKIEKERKERICKETMTIKNFEEKLRERLSTALETSEDKI